MSDDNLAPMTAQDAWPGADEWETWASDWAHDLRHDDRISEATIPVYLRGLAQFASYLAASHPGATEPRRVTAAMVQGWADSLRDAGRAAATRRTRIMGLRAFFTWVRDEPGSGYGDTDPLPTDRVVAPVPDPEAQAAARPPVSAEVLRKILNACGPTLAGYRDAAIVRVLLATGLRRAELCALDVADYDRASELLTVRRGKGGKPRVVPLSAAAARALHRYLRMRRRVAGDDGPLFLSTRTHGRMTGGAVAELLARRCAEAGVPRVVPHQLRHTWAHEVKRAGLSNEDLERMAGWSPGSVMSRRYGAALANERAREALRRLGIGDEI